MLRSSPFLVVYAEFLLLATYLFGMNLTDDELPANVDVNGINLPQIGFIKYLHYPIGPIVLKSAFTVMFWASLRQMLQERAAERQSTALADMVAPLQLTVGAATAREGIQKKQEKEPEFIMKAAKFINAFLVKFWIFIVVITLFVCGITGQQMTGFRIVYMALFLIFVLTFQVSLKLNFLISSADDSLPCSFLIASGASSCTDFGFWSSSIPCLFSCLYIRISSPRLLDISRTYFTYQFNCKLLTESSNFLLTNCF